MKKKFADKVIADIIQQIDIEWSIAEQNNNPNLVMICHCSCMDKDVFFGAYMN